jgi:hypothetical protein
MAKASFQVEFSVTEKGRKAPQWTIDSDLDGQQSLEDLLRFTKTSLILIADTALKEEQAKGFDKKPVVAVDGRVGKPVENVNPLGSIVITARSEIGPIVREIYSGLLERSPVLTGAYKRSHMVFLNGTQVASDLGSLEAWLATKPIVEPKDRIRFVDIQPYARKLERYGITAQRRARRDKKSRQGGTIRAPNGVYYLTYRSAFRKFKNNVQITFKFIPGSDIGLLATFKSASSLRKSSKKAAPRTYLYPSILIRITEGGLK